jgi:hypothetical protein
MEKNKIEIRPLIMDDRDMVAELFKELADKIGSKDILNMMKLDTESVEEVTEKPEEEIGEKQGKSRYYDIGYKLLTFCIEVLKTQVREWFASLAQCKVEEFGKLPFDAEVQILEQIFAAPEVDNFFSGALRLYKKTKELKVK